MERDNHYEFDKALRLYTNCIDRVEKINSFYVSLQTALVSLSSFIINQAGVVEKSTVPAVWILSPIGIALAISWILAIKKQHFDKENTKERLLNIEKKLNLNLLCFTSSKLKKTRYLSSSQYETAVPYMFILLHIILFFKFV